MAAPPRVPNPAGIPHAYHPMLAYLDRRGAEAELAANVNSLLPYLGKRRKGYVGITSTPESRSGAEPDRYDEYMIMVVVAASSRVSNIRAAEATVIEHLRAGGLLDNQADGREGPLPGPRYFLYVCIRPQAVVDPYIAEVVDEFERRTKATAKRRYKNALLDLDPGT